MLKNKEVERTKGITLVALVVTIIVLLILAGVAISLTLGEDGIFKRAEEAADKYKEAAGNERNMLYELESDMDNIIGDPIPIKTMQQLLKIGSGEKVEVDGVEYFFNEGRRYVLQNDIETNEEYDKIAELVKNKKVQIQGNGNRIILTRVNGEKEYYIDDSNFYIAVNNYGYVLDGLELYYDGIDNTGTGNHDNTSTVWKDLSGKGHDGTLTNFGTNAVSGWHNNYLSFDGINDWVNCGEINNANATLEAAYVDKSEINKEFLSNYDTGGLGLYIDNKNYCSSIYSNGEYYFVLSNEKTEKNKLVTQSMSYDGQEQTLYLNGGEIASIEATGDIKAPENSTVMALRL